MCGRVRLHASVTELIETIAEDDGELCAGQAPVMWRHGPFFSKTAARLPGFKTRARTARRSSGLTAIDGIGRRLGRQAGSPPARARRHSGARLEGPERRPPPGGGIDGAVDLFQCRGRKGAILPAHRKTPGSLRSKCNAGLHGQGCPGTCRGDLSCSPNPSGQPPPNSAISRSATPRLPQFVQHPQPEPSPLGLLNPQPKDLLGTHHGAHRARRYTALLRTVPSSRWIQRSSNVDMALARPRPRRAPHPSPC